MPFLSIFSKKTAIKKKPYRKFYDEEKGSFRMVPCFVEASYWPGITKFNLMLKPELESYKIIKLNFQYNSINDYDLITILSAELPYLRNLDVSNNRLTSLGIIASLRHPQLEVLAISCHPFNLACASVLKENVHLKKIVLKQCNINDQVANVIGENRHLTAINCSINMISVEGISAFVKNVTLKDLAIDYNLLGTAGANALSANKNIEKLSIKNNDIKDGLVAWRIHPTLRCLDASNNSIDDKVLCKFLDGNYRIEEITMGWNNLTDICVDALLDKVQVTSIDLRGNTITNNGALRLSQKTNLFYLNLPNEVHEEVRKAIKNNNPHERGILLRRQNFDYFPSLVDLCLFKAASRSREDNDVILPADIEERLIHLKSKMNVHH